jgi:hypothetical protein
MLFIFLLTGDLAAEWADGEKRMDRDSDCGIPFTT